MSFRSVCKRVIHVLKWIPLSIPWAFGLAQIFFVIYCQLRFVIFSSERVTVLKVIESALFLFVALSALICDFRTCFSDPGYANTGDKHHLTSEEFEYYSSRGYKVCKYDASNSKLGSYDYVCRKCQALKPLRAHHCKICQKCILKMDHHCPWVNNCIGARNQKYFLLFLFYVFLGETYASLTGTYRLYKMITASNISYFEHEKIPRSVLTFDFHNRTFSYVDTVMITTITTEYSYIFFSLLFEVVFSYVFMVFAVSISIDQIIGIRNNRTLIEALKKEDRPTSDVTFKDSLISTMGDPFNWKWFFPIEGSMMPKYIQELNNEIVCVNPVYDVEAHEVFNNENESKEEIIEDYDFFEKDGTKKDI